MRFKYVESKMISHVPDISDPERMPWEKNYPENVKYSGYQRTGNFGSDPSTESPHRTPHVPYWTLEAWVPQTEPWLLRFPASAVSLGDTAYLPPGELQPCHLWFLKPVERNSSVPNRANLTL